MIGVLKLVLSSAALVANFAFETTPTPRSYVAKKVLHPLTIDGNLDKPEWDEVEWSEPFGEIRGEDSPPNTRPGPSSETRIKMRWDARYLYIAARLCSQEVGWRFASFTERNSPIFHKDSDFEVNQ